MCPPRQPGGLQDQLGPAAISSIVFYGLGVPAMFFGLLFRHRRAIVTDLTLMLREEGGTASTNPVFHIRKRYQELYRCVPPSRRPCSRPPFPLLDTPVMRCLLERSPTDLAPPPHLPVLPTSLYRPEVFWWRLVLIVRKLLQVTVALMFRAKPLFQAW